MMVLGGGVMMVGRGGRDGRGGVMTDATTRLIFNNKLLGHGCPA